MYDAPIASQTRDHVTPSGETLIAIDPGLATGVAVFHDGILRRAFTSASPHGDLRTLLRQHDDHRATVVLEDVPTLHRHVDDPFKRVQAIVNERRRAYNLIRPSQWKGSPWSRLSEVELAMLDTPHERDAASLGRWFLKRRSYDGNRTSHEAARDESALNEEHFTQPTGHVPPIED